MMMPTRKGFYSAAAKSPILHDDAELKSLLLGRGDALYLAIEKPIRKGFYSAAVTPLIRL